ncbi:MAG: Dodecaprenyl-phosphate galacturonate synthase [Formosa sp. Hel1_33_131]|jgi:glycosyltransferase involved in cell wall biosynthesis|nr:MAG: Dodecaprenyl-phosphate galacturonate synthase [Formosa sp. Hel1_33_131]|tara:strand:- start:6164 stop:6868 length:705 start_codon:yes stop_codon:yes gene_type:complete
MPSNPLLSIVIPIFNEQFNVRPLVDAIENQLSEYAYELIFIDDCSTDGSLQSIQSISNPNLILIAFDQNKGQSSALSAGIQRSRGTYIVTMDGDLQNDPKDIPKMVSLIQNGNWDMVIGVRENRHDSLLKTLPSKIANYIIRKTTRLQVSDSGCALKVMTSKTAKNIPLYDELHRFMALHAHLNGARIKEIPIIHHPRIYGVSKYGLERTFKVLKDLVSIMLKHKRSKFNGVIA